MRIRIEIEDGGFKSSHEFESQSIDKEALRDKIIGFLSASGIFDSKDERGAIATARDYRSRALSWTARALHQTNSQSWFTSRS